MFAPRALVLAIAALASVVAAVPAAEAQQLEARAKCNSATYGPYTCPGACCNCDGLGGPGCLGTDLKCFCIA